MNQETPAAQEKQNVAILCIVAILALLFCTLWPFNPFPTNDIDWLPEADGLQFGRAGLVLSKAPLPLVDQPSRQDEISLELLLRPAAVDTSGTILCFYDPKSPEKFLVRQWTDGLLVAHDSGPEPGKPKASKFDVDHAFQAGIRILLTITSGPHGTVVYRNASPAQAFPGFTIAPRELSGQIVLGTSPVDYEPWQGEIRGLAIYARELTPAEVARHYADWTDVHPLLPPDLHDAIARYPFSERRGRHIHSAVASSPDLEIPPDFDVPHKAMLTSAIKEFAPNHLYLEDAAENIVGFVPLGVILCVYFSFTRSRPRAILYATLVGGFLSFTIEILQAYIPSRVSGMTDIITNTTGTLLGAAITVPAFVLKLLRFVKPLRSSRQPP